LRDFCKACFTEQHCGTARRQFAGKHRLARRGFPADEASRPMKHAKRDYTCAMRLSPKGSITVLSAETDSTRSRDISFHHQIKKSFDVIYHQGDASSSKG
jgi:hypothetical protein